jgi:hypothetical protein
VAGGLGVDAALEHAIPQAPFTNQPTVAPALSILANVVTVDLGGVTLPLDAKGHVSTPVAMGTTDQFSIQGDETWTRAALAGSAITLEHIGPGPQYAFHNTVEEFGAVIENQVLLIYINDMRVAHDAKGHIVTADAIGSHQIGISTDDWLDWGGTAPDLTLLHADPQSAAGSKQVVQSISVADSGSAKVLRIAVHPFQRDAKGHVLVADGAAVNIDLALVDIEPVTNVYESGLDIVFDTIKAYVLATGTGRTGVVASPGVNCVQ